MSDAPTPDAAAAAQPLPTYTYPLRDHGGHLVAEVAGRQLLIDTGAPLSVGPVDVDIAGRTPALNRSFIGITAEDVSREIGTRIDALIGMNVLADYDVRFDVPAKQFVMTQARLALGAAALPITLSGWVPRITALFGARRGVRLLFDTGASLSYLRRTLVGGFAVRRTAEDFYPGFGHFTTPVYRVPFVIGAASCALDFGVLPELLELGLLAGGADGILGSQVLSERVAVLAPRRRLLGMIRTVAPFTGCVRGGTVH